MLAAPGQGNPVAALGAVAEDVDFGSLVPGARSAGILSPSGGVAVMVCWILQRAYEKVPKIRAALESTAEGIGEGRERADGEDQLARLYAGRAKVF